MAPPAGGSGFALCHRTHKIKASAATPSADGDTELPKYVSPSNSATPPREPPVTCEGERLSFRNSIERVREDCICYGPSGIGAALTTKLVDGVPRSGSPIVKSAWRRSWRDAASRKQAMIARPA